VSVSELFLLMNVPAVKAYVRITFMLMELLKDDMETMQVTLLRTLASSP